MSDNHQSTVAPWFALRVQWKSERAVSTILQHKGYELFLPQYRSARQWSDRVKTLEVPLFPGYLFCRMDLTERLMPVLTTPGVLSIVGTGKIPEPIPEHEIEAVRAVLRSGLAATPWTSFAVGDAILIERGPLAGLEGIAIEVENMCRLVVSIPLLQRSVSVEIDRSWARPTRRSALSHTIAAGSSASLGLRELY